MTDPETLYRKVGRRYVPVAVGWREEQLMQMSGVYLFHNDQRGRGFAWMQRLGDAPSVMTHAAFARHRDLIAQAIVEQCQKGRTNAYDLAAAVCRAVAMAEEPARGAAEGGDG